MKNLPLLSLVFILFYSYILSAQDGILDSSFGNNGIVITDLNNSNDVARDVLVQDDGKILVTGYTSNGIIDFFCLIRYNTNGSLDAHFGDNGIVVTPFPSTSIGASIILQSDNKILIGGHTWGGTANEFALARYLPDGSLDTDFGDMGMVTTLFPDKNAIGHSIVLQPDNKIILGGHVYTFDSDADDFALARYHTNGSLDHSFGNEGLVTTNFGNFTMEWLNDLALQEDGKIVAAGFTGALFALARYNIDGNLDSHFGIDGLLTTGFSGVEHGVISSIQIQNDGKILGAGFIRDSFSNFALVRYRSNGNMDTNFGTNGIVTTSISDQSDGIDAIEIQTDGKIIAGGTAYIDMHNQPVLARYNDNGTLDPTFGEDGIVTHTPDLNDSQLTGIALQPDGKILACGFSEDFSADVILSRYTSKTVGIKELSAFPGSVTIYPNPAKDFVTLDYQLNKSYPITINLLNVEGKTIRNIIHNESQNKGQNSRLIALSKLPSGTYFISMQVGKEVYSYEVYHVRE